jgi:lipoprotein-releasing system permease protein
VSDGEQPGGAAERRDPGALPTLPPFGWGLAVALAWRYLRGRKSRLLGGTGRVALLATALGVTAMVVAMALMTGYREDLIQKLVGGSAAVLAYPLDASVPRAEVEQEAALRQLPMVERLSLVAYAQGSLASERRREGVEVTLRAVDLGAEVAGDRFLPLGRAPLVEGASPGGPPGAMLGEELARRLEVATGDALRLTVLVFHQGRPRFAYATLRVAGTFATGFAEFDDSWLALDLAAFERIAGGAGPGRVYEIASRDLAKAGELALEVENVLGPTWMVTDWQRLNGELFAALRLQQWVLFLTLGLIVLVSTFNVASTLVVLVRERARDIGLLAALGFRLGALRVVFLLYGLALGALGTAAGVLLGATSAWILDRFEVIRFGPEVAAIYFLAAVPFRVTAGDVAAVAGFSLLVTLAACWLPSRRALRVEPSAALRYE